MLGVISQEIKEVSPEIVGHRGISLQKIKKNKYLYGWNVVVMQKQLKITGYSHLL